jgi:hypothetical protein
MNHLLFDQARCDIMKQCDEETFSAVLGESWKYPEDDAICSACGRLICRVCGVHIDGGLCPEFPRIDDLMGS